MADNTAEQALQHIPQDAPSLAVSQGLNAATADPARQVSIKEAWSAVVAEHGPVTYETDAGAQPEKAEAQAAETTEAATEDATEVTDEKPAPKVKKAAAKVETDSEAPEADEPAEKHVGVRNLIEERRKLRERFERNERAQNARHEARQRELQAYEQRVHAAGQQLGPVMRAAQALEQGDFDGFAKALGEHLKNDEMKDWSTLNGEALKAVQSPVYKKMRDLERRDAERAAQDAQRQQETQRAQAEQQRQRETAEWKRGIADELSSDEDVAIPAIVESRPELVDAIFAIQNAHYQQTRGDVLRARDAAVQLLSNVRKDFKFWSDFFAEHEDSDVIRTLTGTQASQKKKPAVSNGIQRAETSERRGAKAPKNVSQSQTAQASALAPMNEAQLKKFYQKQMEQDFQTLR